mmetsp:Transcript_17578/g.24457  ORF Transcript_17578/g.24457 Transcript_17578/m.24457 type:complete len:88 (-) Transcript_17578:712-975(-)
MTLNAIDANFRITSNTAVVRDDVCEISMYTPEIHIRCVTMLMAKKIIPRGIGIPKHEIISVCVFRMLNELRMGSVRNKNIGSAKAWV